MIRPWLIGHLGIVALVFWLLERKWPFGLPAPQAALIAAVIFPLRALVWKWPRWAWGLDRTDPPLDWILGAVVPTILMLAVAAYYWGWMSFDELFH